MRSVGGRVGEGCLGWDVEGLAEGGWWEGCLGGEGWSGEAEDFEGEGVWACGLGVEMGHGWCDGSFAYRWVGELLCPGWLGYFPFLSLSS